MRRANSYLQLLIGRNRVVPLMMKIGGIMFELTDDEYERFIELDIDGSHWSTIDINVIPQVLGSKRYLHFLETLVQFLGNDKSYYELILGDRK
jgi:hypothetical protein